MDAPPIISADVFASLPPSVIALIEPACRARHGAGRWPARQIAQLTAHVAELEAEVKALRGKNPIHSSLPPSSTHPHAKPATTKPRSKRARGRQPGHEKYERALIPSQQSLAVVPFVPTACRRCGRALSGLDPEPLRHRVWELPEIQPVVTEYRPHRLVCIGGGSTCGELPPGVPTGQAGPRLIAFAGLLMACFRQSKRRATQFS